MQVRLFNSLRFRLIASVVLIEVVMLSIMVWSNVNSIYTTHTDRLNDTSKSILLQFAQTAGSYMAEVDYAGLEEYADGVLKHGELDYIVIHSKSGKAVLRLGKNIPTKTPMVEKHPTEVKDNVFDVKSDISLADYQFGQVFMGFTLSVMEEAISTARNRSILIAITEIILTVIATILIGYSLTRNLRALSEAANLVGEGNLNVVLPVKRDDEVGQTAKAFNNMVNELEIYREHLEELVEKRTKDLETANKELEAFNSSIAHDLRTPINAISSYCQILYGEYADKLDEQGKGFLFQIKDTASDMTSLIESLLQLSRVTKAEIEKEEVDMSLMATEISQKLSYLNPDRSVDIEIEEDINCNADRGAMIILLDNLMNNAWKYSSKKTRPKIKIGKLDSKEGSYFYVKDNGAGFDMQHSDKLFDVFQRLHTQTEFIGTGVGLATVSRIVNRHGGQIWAESEVEQGATFFVKIPA